MYILHEEIKLDMGKKKSKVNDSRYHNHNKNSTKMNLFFTIPYYPSPGIINIMYIYEALTNGAQSLQERFQE